MRRDPRSVLQESFPYWYLLPGNWALVRLDDEGDVQAWAAELHRSLPEIPERRLADDVRDLLSAIERIPILETHVYARDVDDGYALAVQTVTIVPFTREPDTQPEDALLDLSRRLDESADFPQPASSLLADGERLILRQERVMTSAPGLPWSESREVRYLVEHPSGSVAAVLNFMTPNVSSPALVTVFDAIAGTFRWMPSDQALTATRPGL